MGYGRPTKYKPEYCQKYIEAAKKGSTEGMFASQIGVDQDSLTRWMKKHPAFAEAVKIGRQEFEAWYTKGTINFAVKGNEKPHDTALWIWLGKNKCGWRDKHDVDANVNLNLTISPEEAETLKTE
jgi:transposase